MMKSFFKKLAFVLALAMVVSLAAPAATTASAAGTKEFTYKYQNGLGTAVKTINLAKTGDTVDLKFIGVPDYANYELTWASVGTGFTVDEKTGVVTATADSGNGVVWLAVGDSQTYVSDPINVTIGEYTNVTIGEQDGSNKALEEVILKVGEKKDLAFYGIKDWNLGKYLYIWVPGDSSIIDVDQKTGEITALKAGETTITFMAPNRFNQSNVVQTNSLKVTVLPETEPAIEVVQKTEDDFEILFTDLTAANFTDADIEVVRKAPADKDMDGNGVIDKNDYLEETFFIYPTTADKENNKFVVAGYADFIDGSTYVVRVGKYSYEFVASVGAVARIELKATDAIIASDGVAATPAYLSVKLFDKNGIDVSDVVTDGIINKDRIVYGMEWSDIAYQYGNEITFISEGKVVATAYYDCYNITETNKVEAKVSVIGKKHADYIAKVIAWKAVHAGDKINWNDVVKNNEPLWVAAEDNDYYIVALLEDSRGNYFTTHVEGTTAHTEKKYNDKPVYAMDYVAENIGDSFVFAANGYTLEFATLNPDNLLMYKDGEVVTYKKVTSYVKLNLLNIYSGTTKELATVPLEVRDQRYVKYVEANKTSVSAVTDTYNAWFDADFTNATVTIKAFDQYNAKWYGAVNYVLEPVFDSSYTEREKTLLSLYAAGITLPAAYSTAQQFDVTFNAKAIRQCLDDFYTPLNKSNRNSVSFKLTEKISGRFTTIRVNLQVPNYTGNVEVTGAMKLDEKRTNNLSVYDSFTYGTNVEQSAFFKDGWQFLAGNEVRKAKLDLFISSKNYNVGYELDKLVVYNGSNRTDKYDETIVPGETMMLVVTGPDNKVVAESAYPNALGVQVVAVLDTNDLNGNTATDDALYYKYELVAAAHKVIKNASGSAIGLSKEMNYLQTGKYTVQVRTVKSVWTDTKTGIEYFNFVTLSDTDGAAKTTNVKYITVTNNNDKITFATQTSRDLRESADDIYEVIANAFTFQRAGKDWYTGVDLEYLIMDWDVEYGDGYVYIKKVKFAIPVDKTKSIDNGYYTQWVNVGRSVQISTDLFYWGN